jgi:hypothetical protein
MADIVTTGRIESGRLEIHNRERFVDAIKAARDGPVIVTIERAHATRSASQNAYYHGVVVKLISEHTGYSPKETHELLKALHLPRDLASDGRNGVLMGAEQYVLGGSTAKLNKVEFGEFVEAVRRWAAEEIGLAIPDPQET